MLAALYRQSSTAARLWHEPKRPVLLGDDTLRDLVTAGVAFHHGGIDGNDRQVLEKAFLDGDLSVLCCTSTLAVGVNLPCYLVIVKGTVGYADNRVQEYSSLEMMQMLGRAGRPQFEKSAAAVILTTDARKQHYEKLISGQDIIESCLHLNLTEHLCAEIGLGTVYDKLSALRWLGGTFMSIRMEKNLKHYADVLPVAVKGVVSRSVLLHAIIDRDLADLQGNQLVVQNATKLDCTEIGAAMSRYYVQLPTMKMIISLPPKAKLSEIVSTRFAFPRHG